MDGIGGRIKSIRNSANLDQLQFSEIFKVTRQTVSNWETEKQPPDLDNIIKIAEFGKVTLDFLIKGIDYTELHKKEIEQKNSVIKDLLERYGELSLSVKKDININGTERKI